MLELDFTEIKNYINSHDEFLVFTHENPDGDSVGSTLALCHFLNSIGKKSHPISKGPFNKTEIAPFEAKFNDEIPIIPTEKTGSIIIDCSSVKRTGFASPCTTTFKVIDHHSVVEDDAGTGLIDINSPSTSLLVCALILDMNAKLSTFEANHLFRSFCTDTGFFRHLKPESHVYLSLVASMLEYGASPNKTYDDLQGSYSLESRKFTGYLLNKIEAYYESKLLIICEREDDRKKFDGDLDKDSDTIFRVLLSVENVEVALLLKESEKGISASFRSKNNVNVAEVASKFGGGGHIKAAGCLLNSNLNQARQTILETIKPLILK